MLAGRRDTVRPFAVRPFYYFYAVIAVENYNSNATDVLAYVFGLFRICDTIVYQNIMVFKLRLLANFKATKEKSFV